MQNTVTSFSSIANPNATILILGSMPGVASLSANQYYAHPRNAFWPIMSSFFGFEASLPYQERIEKLKAVNVALWDVLQQCEREGSLDSAIKAGSRHPNDFNAFLKQHQKIHVIAFNGAEAENSFKKYVKPTLTTTEIQLVRLPSTSPAHTMKLDQKKQAWHAALRITHN